MPSSKSTYDLLSGTPSLVVKEEHIEYGFIGKLQILKYEYRHDIRDRGTLEHNLRHMRGFYQAFPIRDALRRELSRTHDRLPSRIDSKAGP